MFAKIEVIVCAVVWSLLIGVLAFLFPLWPLLGGLAQAGIIAIELPAAFALAAVAAAVLASYAALANIRHGALQSMYRYAFKV